MISLTVATFNGAPLAQAPSAQFDELGGSIGRADNNQLVLPDPDRTISRVHARVVFRNGVYIVQDCGSNPVSINNRPLGNGQESPIKPGDQIVIGGYAIKVEAAAAANAKVVDPFADFGGLAAAAPAARAAAPSGGLDPLAAFGAPAPAAGGSDPFASFGGGFGSPPPPGRSGGGMGGGFGGGFGAPAPASAPAAGGIPDDWDPFAADASAAKPKSDPFASNRAQDFGMEVGAKGAGPLIPDFPGSSAGGGGGGDSLDNLFGLGPAASSGSSDPFANTPLQAIHAQPNMAASADPLRSLNSVTQASATAAADNRSELNSPFDLPAMKVPSALPPPAVPMAPARAPAMLPQAPASALPADPGGTMSGAVVSWGETAPEGRTIIRSRTARPAAPKPAADPWPSAPGAVTAPGLPSPAAAPGLLPALDPMFDPLGGAPLASGSAPMPMASSSSDSLDFDLDLDIGGPAPTPRAAMAEPPLGVPPPPVAPAPAAAARPSQPAVPAKAGHAAAGADADELLAALREGLSLPNLPIDRLTPQMMRLLGQLLFHSVQGTVDLLVARAALKREVRAEVTMIVAKENNPLKFSPTVEVAMEHLLKPPARGFMPPDRAMQDAYDDLRAHQFGFLAGMRAALEGVLRRFDPTVLESKLSKGSVLSSMIPGSRKARMWDVFQEMYGQISSEAADDFHELFGKEFLKAYEAHIDQLKDRR